MNVFVLSTGRSGTTTFIKACHHITNYTAGHESRSTKLGKKRFYYPPNHIEADNRLSWLLGRLDKNYGDSAFYVHLKRDKMAVAQSLNKRWRPTGIITAYAYGILMTEDRDLKYCLDYVDTVNNNIELFLKDKNHKMEMTLSGIEEKLPEFWHRIEAKGDLAEALATLNKVHNENPSTLEVMKNRMIKRVKKLVPWESSKA